MSKLYEVSVEGTIYVMADSAEEAAKLAERNAYKNEFAYIANPAREVWDDWDEYEPWRSSGDETHQGKTCAEILKLESAERPDPRQQNLPLEGKQ